MNRHYNDLRKERKNKIKIKKYKTLIIKIIKIKQFTETNLHNII